MRLPFRSDWDAERNIYNASLRRLAAERKRAHGELVNPILEQRSTIKTEQLSYTSFPKNSVAA